MRLLQKIKNLIVHATRMLSASVCQYAALARVTTHSYFEFLLKLYYPSSNTNKPQISESALRFKEISDIYIYIDFVLVGGMDFDIQEPQQSRVTSSDKMLVRTSLTVFHKLNMAS